MKVFKLVLTLVMLFFSTYSFSSEFESLKEKAEQGDARSQLRLGLAYKDGKGVEKNSVEGTKWIELAAKNGDSIAQYLYGLYSSNLTERFEWLTKAAEGGVLRAQVMLGDIYRDRNNEYVEFNIEKALFWLKEASEQNKFDSISASFRLYLMYEYGENVNKDKLLAADWLIKTLKQNEYKAKELYESSEGDSVDAFTNLMLAAEMGYPEAQNKLGKVYIYGKSYFSPYITYKLEVPADGKKTIKWLRLAANNGLVDANYQLGYIYENGILNLNKNIETLWAIESNKPMAINYYILAAEKNHVKAKERLNRRNTFKSDPWTEYDTARSWYFNHYLEYTWFQSSVSFSKAGEKRIYFSIDEEKDICEPVGSDREFSSAVWEINKQAISMITFCEKNHKGFYTVSATPKTNEGSDFIVNTFLKHTGDVQVEGSGYSFPISANGFTKVWRNKSANAL